jgi:hypothetical protein
VAVNPLLAQPPLVLQPPVVRIQWEPSIDDVLMADTETPQKVRALCDRPQRVRSGGAAPGNLLPDTNYTAVAHLLTNALTAPDVIDVLVGDLLNRPTSSSCR